MAARTYTNPITGKQVTMDEWGGEGSEFWGPADGYYYNNLFRWGFDKEDVQDSIEFFLRNGYDGSDTDRDKLKQFMASRGESLSNDQLDMIIEDTSTWLSKNNINIDDLNEYYAMGGTYENPNPELLTPESRAAYQKKLEEDAQKTAFDAYYNDLFSLNEGTLGADMLQRYEEAERNAALSNMQLAEAQYQQAAMQQAETVKNITEQVKAERMAKLRAGMSESQIANQEMQVMLNNTNTLNQQMNAMNQNQLAARQQLDLAQDTAYQQYINSATNMGAIGASYSAANAGSLDYTAKQLQANSKGKLSYLDAVKLASGQTNK